MNKSTISTLLIGVTAAAGILYVLGVFDNSPSSVSIETSVTDGATGPTSSEASISITPKEETPKETIPTQTITTSTINERAALTKATVAQHATKNDCWVIIRDNVYDLTAYIPRHRGGERVVIETCGTDGTSAFTNVRKHLKPSIETELATYLLGALVK